MYEMNMWMPMTEAGNLVVLAFIYVAAAIMSGLSGFGFSAVGALSLLYLPPVLAVSILMLLSLAGQAFSMGRLWSELIGFSKPWNRPDSVVPYCLGGVLGIPLGIKIISEIDSQGLMFVLGLFLIICMTPLVLIGTGMGVAIYRKTSQVNYRKLTFVALGISGIGLLIKIGLTGIALD